MNKNYMRCYAEIDLDAILHNILEMKKRLNPEVKMMAVIKADGYGHGAIPIAKKLHGEVQYFGVAMLEEAVTLRENGITEPILILGYTSPSQYEDLINHDITQTIYSLDTAVELSEAAVRLDKTAKMHLALDTGMTRIGLYPTRESLEIVKEIMELPNLFVEGMFTHFSTADETDKEYSRLQMERYDSFVDMLNEEGIEIPVKHMCNSAGIMEFDTHRFAMVRSGITTYGLYPSEEVDKTRADLIPALRWVSHVGHVKTVGEGFGVSYGKTYVTEGEATTIATVTVGYADGYPRALSNKGRVIIRGQYAPIIGRVCMDQLMVDVSHIPGVSVEDEVTLIGKDGDCEITVEEAAGLAGSFNYEFVCGLNKRIPRIYKSTEKKAEPFVLSETWAADNIQELDDWIESQGIYLRQ